MDERPGIGMFGGVAGRLLRDATSPGTAFTGLVLGVILLASGFVCRMVNADVIGQLLGQIVMAAALARFALNGYAGEYRGTILSTAGGTWPETLRVAGRYLALQLLWVVPVFLLGWSAFASVLRPETNTVALAPYGPDTVQPAPSPGAAALLPILGVLNSGAFLWSIGLMFFGMLLLPPVFLIVSVRSEKFGDIFSPALWSATFGGRLGDLYTLYAVQAGGVMMGMVVIAPVVLIGFTAGSGPGILALAGAMGFLAGLTVTLMGRLCGFFAFGDESPVSAMREPQPAGEMFRVGSTGALRAGASVAVSDVPPETAAGMDAAGMDAAGMGAAGLDAAGMDAGGMDAGGDSALPPLLDGPERAAAMRRHFETDRDGAIAECEALRMQFAPSPQVLHVLALMLHEAGRIEDGTDVARDALALCLKLGHAEPAAELFTVYWKQAKSLGLSVEQIDFIATALLKGGNLAHATTAFGVALNLEPGDRRAVKGLMTIASIKLHKDAKPKDAARIYTFLLQYAANSPFAEDMRQGLAEAETRLKRAA